VPSVIAVAVKAAPFSVKLTLLPAANPVPVTVIEAPGAAVVGAAVMCELTMNDLWALLVPSLAVTSWLPWGTAGIANVVEKPPVLLDVGVVSATPENETVTVVLGRNPVPVTVSMVPTIRGLPPVVKRIFALDPIVRVFVA